MCHTCPFESSWKLLGLAVLSSTAIKWLPASLWHRARAHSIWQPPLKPIGPPRVPLPSAPSTQPADYPCWHASRPATHAAGLAHQSSAGCRWPCWECQPPPAAGPAARHQHRTIKNQPDNSLTSSIIQKTRSHYQAARTTTSSVLASLMAQGSHSPGSDRGGSTRMDVPAPAPASFCHQGSKPQTDFPAKASLARVASLPFQTLLTACPV